jgi:hypothetical protein
MKKSTCFLAAMVATGGFATTYSVFLAARTPVAGQTAKPAPSAYEKLLTAADVESATGIKGVKRVASGSVEGAAGDLNFVQADGTMLLMVEFGDDKVFQDVESARGQL